jgi:hypothetical protein
VLVDLVILDMPLLTLTAEGETHKKSKRRLHHQLTNKSDFISNIHKKTASPR